MDWVEDYWSLLWCMVLFLVHFGDSLDDLGVLLLQCFQLLLEWLELMKYFLNLLLDLSCQLGKGGHDLFFGRRSLFFGIVLSGFFCIGVCVLAYRAGFFMWPKTFRFDPFAAGL